MTSTSRTARCGPACRVVWQGSDRKIAPYADFGRVDVTLEDHGKQRGPWLPLRQLENDPVVNRVAVSVVLCPRILPGGHLRVDDYDGAGGKRAFDLPQYIADGVAVLGPTGVQMPADEYDLLVGDLIQAKAPPFDFDVGDLSVGKGADCDERRTVPGGDRHDWIDLECLICMI